MIKIDKLVNVEQRDKILADLMVKIKKYCYEHFYNKERNSFVRNCDDNKIDISILGAITPFKMLDPEDNFVLNTIEKMNMTIKTYTGGYLRYEWDGYRGGGNPWPIANLWMALYYLEIGNTEKALENFNFVVETATELGFLGEQVNNENKEANWVIGLAWSHAMFLIVLDKLKGDIL